MCVFFSFFYVFFMLYAFLGLFIATLVCYDLICVILPVSTSYIHDMGKESLPLSCLPNNAIQMFYLHSDTRSSMFPYSNDLLTSILCLKEALL